MTHTAPCSEQRLVDRHFAGRLGVLQENEMRAHLPGCAACRDRYERHLLYAELTGRGRSAQERIAQGLELGRPSERPWRVFPLSLATATAAAAMVAVMFQPTRHPPQLAQAPKVAPAKVATPPKPAGEFTPRGAPPGGSAALQIYEVPRTGKPYLADGKISPRRELAFTYVNPRGYKKLLVFGIDDRGAVFWFYPEWTKAALNPEAVAIKPGLVPLELEAAIRHQLRGQRLRVVGIFTDESLTVREVEERVRSGDLNFRNSERVESTLEIEQ
jgi:hypothetical protein